MPLICPSCDEERVFGAGDHLHCSGCQWVAPFTPAPLLLVVGTSAVGKTTLVPLLRHGLPGVAIFDKDLLPRFIPRPDSEQPPHAELLNEWLRVVYGLAQCGIQSLLCGWLTPWELEECADRGLIGDVHTLVLDVTDEVRESRTRERKQWRLLKGLEHDLAGSKEFADHLRQASSQLGLEVLDVSHLSPVEVAGQVSTWAAGFLRLLPASTAPAC
jgi:hypothetical protein